MQTEVPVILNEKGERIIFFYKPKWGGRHIGSFSEYKIKQMIRQDYKHQAEHRDPLSCAVIDFLITIQGDIHNDEWID